MKFDNALFYTDAILGNYDLETTLYVTQESNSWSVSSDQKYSDTTILPLKAPENAYFSTTFHQGQVSFASKVVRVNFYSLILGFGSQLSFFTGLTVLCIETMQGFSLKNSLIKRLYSNHD